MVGKKMKYSSSNFADVIKSGSIDCKDVMGQLHRYGRRQSKISAVDESESLSDIDDEELCSYLNSKEEIRFKKALWEQINREQTKISCVKPAAETKRAGLVKKASKVTVEAENENFKAENRKRQSSKINYDALDNLEADWDIMET